MKLFTKKSIRPSQFVLIGDQLLIVFGLHSSITEETFTRQENQWQNFQLCMRR